MPGSPRAWTGVTLAAQSVTKELGLSCPAWKHRSGGCGVVAVAGSEGTASRWPRTLDEFWAAALL